jgi:hypothetical protein
MAMNYRPHRRILLKSDPQFTEKWLQERIGDDPSVLGLGELDVKEVERSQPRAGRLDMLLYDPESNTRYEVELQLGTTDESHIIRTIEYWDNERKKFPQYEHVAVIVAEEITARFFNVISLLAGQVPIVAIQVNAVELGDAVTLVFTKVLDLLTLGIEETDDPDEPRDRLFWEKKAAPVTISLTDSLMALVREVEPAASFKYNKNYIGIERHGVVSNFITFRPGRSHVRVGLKLPRDEEVIERLEDAGIPVLTYQARWGDFRIQLTKEAFETNRDLLLDLIRRAHRNYGP